MDHLNDRERKRIADLYLSRIDRHGLTVDALKSGGIGKQWVRHTIHAEAFELSGRHVLDVGCGIAMFLRFLMARGVILASYTGIDIVGRFLEANRVEFPRSRFLSVDILNDPLDGLATDVVFMSQVFNNKYADADNEAVARRAVSRLFDIAREGLVIDFMSTHVDWRDPDLHYFDPKVMFEFGKSITRFVDVRHDYLPFEYTLILRKAPRLSVPDDEVASMAYKA